MISFKAASIVVALLAPVAVGLIMRGHESVMVNAAIKATRVEEQTTCNARVTQIEIKLNRAADAASASAAEAADAMESTPDVPADLHALCERSASCMSRRRP